MQVDLIFEGGTLLTMDPARPRATALAVHGGRIVAVGTVDERADSTLDADGLVVAPGFVDLHTHYDGQVSWDPDLTPSSTLGVTTCVMGSCGVGFAPVRPGRESTLVELMEGVEDIPGSALAEGIPWGWESFADYMAAIAAMLCGIGRRLYSKPGAAVPTVGTDACGFARGGIVSAGDSHGSIFGCCLKSVNQLQALNSRTGSAREMRDTRLALTSHLLGPVLLQNVHRRVGAVRIGHHPDAEVPTAEARVVANGHRQAWNA